MTDTKLDGLIAARDSAQSYLLMEIAHILHDIAPPAGQDAIGRAATAFKSAEQAIAAERKSVEVLISTQDRLGRDRDIILEAINEYDGWILDDDYDADRMLGKIMMRMKERIEIPESPCVRRFP